MKGVYIISVIQYADETLMFLEVKEFMYENLWDILLWFEVASVLQLNNTKTKAYRFNELINWS